MPIEMERLGKIKKMIACSVDTSDEITEVLVLLARTPQDEWEQIIATGRNHRKMLTTGLCVLCSVAYRTYRNVNTDICDRCCSSHTVDMFRVHTQCYRAKKAGLPATLTLAEWLSSVAHFNQLCAYCQEREYGVLDHFIPIILGGGTTQDNCVPACVLCNQIKTRSHPDKVRGIQKTDIERVYEFLNSLKIAS